MSASPPENLPPVQAAPRPLIVRTQFHAGRRDGVRGWRVLGVCVFASLAVHAALVVTLLLARVEQSAAASVDVETAVIDTQISDQAQKEPDLVNDDIGVEPELPTQYNVARVEEFSIPGTVNAAESAGMPSAPPGPAATVPPPPGFGSGDGGGALEKLLSSSGGLPGVPGGLGGLRMTPGGFGGRSAATREQLVREGGGNPVSEAAVARGLKWLVAHQAPDGRWSLDKFHRDGRCNCGGGGQDNDVAATAFALLPLLGAGHTHKPTPGNVSPYAKNVERSLRFLITQQAREGSFNGDMYAQGLASIAVCEAYGLTADPQLKGPAQNAINFICRAQNDRGGWDYAPRGPTPDTSIGGWQIMALKSGQMSGLDVPSRTLDNARRWLNDWAGDADGSLYGYRQPKNMNPSEGGASPQSMVAIGLLCRQYLGWGPKNPGLVKGAGWLMQPDNMPSRQARSHMYFWYYGTQVVHHMGGGFWARWNPAMRDFLIATQDQGQDPKHPHQKGSWDGKVDWWCAPGGRVMMTSMCLLTLEVYYRHLPLYRRDMGGGK